MKYKLIATDLDGTLGNSNYTVDEENAIAARKFEDAGGLVVLCSGRSVHSLKYVAEKELKIKDSYLIGFNGGVIVNSSDMKPLYERRLSKEYALEGYNFLKNHDTDKDGKPQLIIGLYTKFDEILTDRKELLEKLYIKQNNKMNLIQKDEINYLEEDIYKLLILGENETLKEIEPKLINLAKDRYDIVFTGANLLELVPKNTNKGEALAYLASHLNIKIEETIGFGDNYNDLELIKRAGLGIAIKNAVEPLKQIADMTTEKDNDNYAFAEVVNLALLP